jgi:YVTN family beta-propeller protein
MLRRLLSLGLLTLGGHLAAADAGSPAARLIFQDHDTRTLRWADVREAADATLTLGPVATVAGFPTLDPTKQTLVQMRECKGRVLVGVRDDDDGRHGSGWVMLVTGTKYTDHGDHGHWSYKKRPQVVAARIDADQGNPAHLYLADGLFYLANDLKSGYTRLDPADFYLAGTRPVAGRPLFVPGGGNHITLATVGNRVGYAAWIDGGGPNKGRVDVTPIADQAAIKYSFHLPTGVIHGAAACGGKVFFAPADGVCWVDADPTASRSAGDVRVRHIPLGTDGDKPLRTGAFETHGRHVLCVTGKGAGGRLVILDAAAADPKPTFVRLNGQAGHKPLTPAVVAKDGKNPLAFVFHDHDADAQVEDVCDVVALDPNGDGRFDDARVVKTVPVGPSRVRGHFGHHAIGFDADARTAYLTNPGDGTIMAVDLKTLAVQATFKVGGQPTALVVVGGRDHED